MSRIIAEIRRFKVSLTELWMDSQLTYIFFKRVRFSRNFVSSSWCEREGPSKSDENGDSKNYASLYATISRRPKVVSKRMKKRFKGEDFALPMIVRSSIGSRSLRSYNGLKFFFFSFNRSFYHIWFEESVVINFRTAMAEYILRIRIP